MRARIFPVLAFAVLIVGTACTSTPSHPRDHLEPMNRAIYRFNVAADRAVVKPVAQQYHDNIPSGIRSGVRNFFNNLADASSTVNYSLQGQGQPALYHLSRFLLNTTVGLLGIFNVCGSATPIYPHTGFGDTFAVWGWQNSNYLVVPFAGPSTLRDGTGSLSAIHFQSQLLYSHTSRPVAYGAALTTGVDARERMLDKAEPVEDSDPYAVQRDVWLQTRARRTGDTP